jgi:hypothetical protein
MDSLRRVPHELWDVAFQGIKLVHLLPEKEKFEP